MAKTCIHCGKVSNIFEKLIDIVKGFPFWRYVCSTPGCINNSQWIGDDLVSPY